MATIKDELVKELKSNEHIVQIFPLEDFVTKQETGQKFSSWDHLKTQKRPNTPRYNFIPEWEDTKPIARFGAQYASVARDAEMARRLAREFGMAGRVMIKRWVGKPTWFLKGIRVIGPYFLRHVIQCPIPRSCVWLSVPRGLLNPSKAGLS